MQQQSQRAKLKAVKHALSILQAEKIPLSASFLNDFYKKNNIDMTKGPTLQKRKEGYNGCRYNA